MRASFVRWALICAAVVYGWVGAGSQTIFTGHETGTTTTSAALNISLSGLGQQTFDIPLAQAIDLVNVPIVELNLLRLDAHWTGGSGSAALRAEHRFTLMLGGSPVTDTAIGFTNLGVVTGSSFDTHVNFRVMLTVTVPLAADTLRVTLVNSRTSGTTGSVSSTISGVGGALALHAPFGGFGQTDANVVTSEAPPTAFTHSSSTPQALYVSPWSEFSLNPPIPASGLRVVIPPGFAWTFASVNMGCVIEYQLRLDDGSTLQLDDVAGPGGGGPQSNVIAFDGFLLLDNSAQALLAERKITGWRARLLLRNVPGFGTTTFTMGTPRSLRLVFDDTDHDGLWNRWEVMGGGVDSNGDGVIDLDLAGAGASPDRKDVFVEVDSMVTRGPTPAVLQGVEAAFAASPGNIRLHCQLDGDQDIPLGVWVEPTQWTAFDRIKNGVGGLGPRFGTPAERASMNWPNIRQAKRLVYRYCIFASLFITNDTVNGVTQQAACSGQCAGIVSPDFFVSLTEVAPQTEQALQGTFMHELGHALGLTHGGSTAQALENYMPNYYSVMNYYWQIPLQNPNIAAWWRLDYSHDAWSQIDESALFEAVGVAAPAGAHVPADLRVPYVDAAGHKRLVRANGSEYADWTGDNLVTFGQAQVDINPDPRSATPRQSALTGHNDWAALQPNFRRSQRFTTGGVPGATQRELTAPILAILNAWPGPCDADINRDGLVDFLDLNSVLSDYGTAGFGLRGDVNDDGVVDFLDLNDLLSAYGNPC